jgi:MFS family permease
VGGVSALRASVAFAPALLALAFLAGLASSVWPVSISPAVAQLTSERNRSLGFSMVFSSGIAIGIFGGLIGGRLPGWLARLNGSPLTWMQYREALIASCAIALMAAWPSAGLKFRGEVTGAAGLRRPSPRLVRFLIAGAVWNLGTGAFNPFFSAFFARLKVPVEMIGGIFSAAQLAQVGAILSAPLLLRRLGLIRGISSMQLLTAGALLCLAVAGGPLTASAGYGIYMVFQYMSEPGLYTMLMDSVPETERGSASGLNFLVAASAQAIAAGLAGAMVERMGYPAVLMIAACLCAIAGVLFRTLLGGSYRSSAAGKA